MPIELTATPPALYNPQTQTCRDCGVRRFALFGALDDQALAGIHHRIADVSLEPGELLFAANQHGQAAYTLREGVVRLERASERGARRIVRLVGRSALVGMEAMLGQTYAADAIACTPLRACRLPRALLDDLGSQNAELQRNLMQRWQAAVDEAEEWLTELTAGSARWRLLRLLLKLSEFGDADGRIWLPSRQDMGAMLNMTVETASRGIAALRRDGVLQPVDPRHARVDMPRLLERLNVAATG